jgi:hypothetical protein
MGFSFGEVRSRAEVPPGSMYLWFGAEARTDGRNENFWG